MNRKILSLILIIFVYIVGTFCYFAVNTSQLEIVNIGSKTNTVEVTSKNRIHVEQKENPDFNIIVRGNNALFYDEYNILLGSISNASSIEFECDNWFSKIGFYVSIDSNVSDECLICVEEFKNGFYVRTICWSSLFLSNNINNKTYCEVDFSEPIQKAKISVRKSNFCSEISFFIGNIIFDSRYQFILKPITEW